MVTSLAASFSSLSQVPGPRLIDGSDIAKLISIDTSSATGLVAHSGGTQAPALPLTASFNEVDTVAVANDSVMLPPALPGSVITIYNATATSMQVFGQTSNPANASAGDTIAAHGSITQVATATGVAQIATSIATYYCFTLGQWKQFLTA